MIDTQYQKHNVWGKKKKSNLIKTKCSVKVHVKSVIGQATDWQLMPYGGIVCEIYKEIPSLHGK